MEIQLSPELEQIVKDKVASGMYPNAYEFVRAAILHAVERDRLKRQRLNDAIAIGMGTSFSIVQHHHRMESRF